MSDYIDLSHLIHDKMPLYPGSKQPRIEKTAELINDGFQETKLSFTSHIGTHIDAPAHMLGNGKSLDKYPISRFTGKAYIIKIPERIKIIRSTFLSNYNNHFKNVDFILFNTGWGRFWDNEKYFQNFPVLSSDAAKYLISLVSILTFYHNKSHLGI